MKLEDIKGLGVIVGACLGLLAAFGICVAIVIGIPAAAIVWIIETIQGEQTSKAVLLMGLGLGIAGFIQNKAQKNIFRPRIHPFIFDKFPLL